MGKNKANKTDKNDTNNPFKKDIYVNEEKEYSHGALMAMYGDTTKQLDSENDNALYAKPKSTKKGNNPFNSTDTGNGDTPFKSFNMKTQYNEIGINDDENLGNVVINDVDHISPISLHDTGEPSNIDNSTTHEDLHLIGNNITTKGGNDEPSKPDKSPLPPLPPDHNNNNNNINNMDIYSSNDALYTGNNTLGNGNEYQNNINGYNSDSGMGLL